MSTDATHAGRHRWAAASNTGPLRPVAAVVSLVVVLLLAGCSAVGGADAGMDRPIFSADVGCDPRMDAAFQAWADRGVGASIVDVGGQRECVAAYGIADLATGRPNTPDTVFAIGSITKAVTAAAIFDLIDRGDLTLDDTAGEHVPDLGGPAADATIRDLLLHTSGVTGEHGFDHVPMTKEEAIASISELDRASEAGTEYLYMNANYTVLALIIDEVTERGYRRYVVEEIMHDGTGRALGGWWDGTPAPDGPRAWGYFADQPAEQRGDAPGPHWAMEGNGLMAMTPLEMAQWIYAFFSDQILSPEATDHLLATSTLLAGDDKELPGWAEVDRTRFGEPIYATAGGGSGIGHEMTVAWMPESARVVVIAENRLDHDVPAFAIEILPALATGTGVPSPPTVPRADPATIAAAGGRYRLADDAELRVDPHDGGLIVTARGSEALAVLRPVPDDHVEAIPTHRTLLGELLAGGARGDDRRLLERLEDLHGPLLEAELTGTHWDGELVSTVVAEFEGRTVGLVGWVDPLGNAHVALGDQPAATTDFFVYDDDRGGFTVRFPNERNPIVVIRPAADGIEIEHPGGRMVAPEITGRGTEE